MPRTSAVGARHPEADFAAGGRSPLSLVIGRWADERRPPSHYEVRLDGGAATSCTVRTIRPSGKVQETRGLIRLGTKEDSGRTGQVLWGGSFKLDVASATESKIKWLSHFGSRDFVWTRQPTEAPPAASRRPGTEPGPPPLPQKQPVSFTSGGSSGSQSLAPSWRPRPPDNATAATETGDRHWPGLAARKPESKPAAARKPESKPAAARPAWGEGPDGAAGSCKWASAAAAAAVAQVQGNRRWADDSPSDAADEDVADGGRTAAVVAAGDNSDGISHVEGFWREPSVDEELDAQTKEAPPEIAEETASADTAVAAGGTLEASDGMAGFWREPSVDGDSHVETETAAQEIGGNKPEPSEDVGAACQDVGASGVCHEATWLCRRQTETLFGIESLECDSFKRQQDLDCKQKEGEERSAAAEPAKQGTAEEGEQQATGHNPADVQSAVGLGWQAVGGWMSEASWGAQWSHHAQVRAAWEAYWAKTGAWSSVAGGDMQAAALPSWQRSAWQWHPDAQWLEDRKWQPYTRGSESINAKSNAKTGHVSDKTRDDRAGTNLNDFPTSALPDEVRSPVEPPSEQNYGDALGAVINAIKSLPLLEVLTVVRPLNLKEGVPVIGDSGKPVAGMQVIFIVRPRHPKVGSSCVDEGQPPELPALQRIADELIKMQAQEPSLWCFDGLKVERDALRMSLGDVGVPVILRFRGPAEEWPALPAGGPPKPVKVNDVSSQNPSPVDASHRDQGPYDVRSSGTPAAAVVIPDQEREDEDGGSTLRANFAETVCSSPALAVGSKVLACFYGEWHPATVRAIQEGMVEVLWESEASISLLSMDEVRLAPGFQPGDKVSARFYGAWYPATIRKVEGPEIEVLWDAEHAISRLLANDVVSAILPPRRTDPGEVPPPPRPPLPPSGEDTSPPPPPPPAHPPRAHAAPLPPLPRLQETSACVGASTAVGPALEPQGNEQLRPQPWDDVLLDSDTSEDFDLSCVRDESGLQESPARTGKTSRASRAMTAAERRQNKKFAKKRAKQELAEIGIAAEEGHATPDSPTRCQEEAEADEGEATGVVEPLPPPEEPQSHPDPGEEDERGGSETHRLEDRSEESEVDRPVRHRRVIQRPTKTMKLSSSARRRQRIKAQREHGAEQAASSEAPPSPLGGAANATSDEAASVEHSCLLCNQRVRSATPDDAEGPQTKLKICPRHFRRLSVLEQRLTRWAMAAPIHDINALHALSLPNVEDWYSELFLDLKMFGLLVEFLLEQGHDPCQEGSVGSPLDAAFDETSVWLKEHDLDDTEGNAKQGIGHLNVVAVLAYHWRSGRGAVAAELEKPILKLVQGGKRRIYPILDTLRPEGEPGHGELSASEEEDDECSEEESDAESGDEGTEEGDEEDEEEESEDEFGTRGKRFCECKCNCSHTRYNLDSLRVLRKRILAKERKRRRKGGL